MGSKGGGEMMFREIRDFIQRRRFFLTLLLYFVSFLTPVLLVGIISYYSTNLSA